MCKITHGHYKDIAILIFNDNNRVYRQLKETIFYHYQTKTIPKTPKFYLLLRYKLSFVSFQLFLSEISTHTPIL